MKSRKIFAFMLLFACVTFAQAQTDTLPKGLVKGGANGGIVDSPEARAARSLMDATASLERESWRNKTIDFAKWRSLLDWASSLYSSYSEPIVAQTYAEIAAIVGDAIDAKAKMEESGAATGQAVRTDASGTQYRVGFASSDNKQIYGLVCALSGRDPLPDTVTTPMTFRLLDERRTSWPEASYQRGRQALWWLCMSANSTLDKERCMFYIWQSEKLIGQSDVSIAQKVSVFPEMRRKSILGPLLAVMRDGTCSKDSVRAVYDSSPD